MIEPLKYFSILGNTQLNIYYLSTVRKAANKEERLTFQVVDSARMGNCHYSVSVVLLPESFIMNSAPIAPPITETQNHSRLLIVAEILIGIGLAGFFDDIVLPQVLQWHHMLSSVRPSDNVANLEINTFWDGIFHIGAYVLTISGLILTVACLSRLIFD